MLKPAKHCLSALSLLLLLAGFDALLAQLNDLSLDTPNAAELLGNFIARAVADDCLPPAFVDNHISVVDGAAQ